MADSRVPGIVSVLALLVGVALAVASELARQVAAYTDCGWRTVRGNSHATNPVV